MVSELVFRDNFIPFGEYAKVNLRYTLKTKPVMYVLILPLLSVIGFWTILPWRATSATAFFRTVADNPMVIGMTLFLLAIPISMWRGMKKNYASVRFMQAPADYSFSALGLDVKSPIMQSQTSWEAFNSFYQFDRYGVLMTSTMTGYFLDFSKLQAPADIADFLHLLKTHSVQIK